MKTIFPVTVHGVCQRDLIAIGRHSGGLRCATNSREPKGAANICKRTEIALSVAIQPMAGAVILVTQTDVKETRGAVPCAPHKESGQDGKGILRQNVYVLASHPLTGVVFSPIVCGIDIC